MNTQPASARPTDHPPTHDSLTQALRRSPALLPAPAARLVLYVTLFFYRPECVRLCCFGLVGSSTYWDCFLVLP